MTLNENDILSITLQMSAYLHKDLILEKVESSRDNLVFKDIKYHIIVRISLNKSFEDTVFESEYVDYLFKHDVMVPKKIGYGQLTYHDLRLPFCIFEYIEHVSSYVPGNVPKIACINGAIELLKIHNAGKQYCLSYNYVQERTITGDISTLIHNIKQGMFSKASNRDDVLKNLRWAIDFVKNEQANNLNPMTIIHNDYRLNNVLFTKSGNIASVIDFDYSLASEFPQKDVAHAALEWSFKDKSIKMDWRCFNLFVESYANHAGLSFDDYMNSFNIIDWAKYSALLDAAHYFLCFPSRSELNFSSNMYDKFLYLRSNND